jgi:hypothetical protein
VGLGVGQDHLQEDKELAGVAIQDPKGAVMILQVGRMNGDGKYQAEGIDKKMALLAFDPLARVISRRVDARAPFSALLTLWLSVTAALGQRLGLVCDRDALL